MAVNQIIASVLIISQLQWVSRCDFSSIDYYSKDLTFPETSKGRGSQLIIVNTPETNAYSKHFYFNYMSCDPVSSNCELGQDCFNCPKSYAAKKCHFRSPYKDHSFPLDRVSLKTFGDFGEHAIVDWASKAVVNGSSERRNHRKVQLISLDKCIVQDVSIELSSEDNGMRKLVLEPLPMTKSFELFHIDYQACGDSGWVRTKYSPLGKQRECISGVEKSKHKFVMDVVVGSDRNEIILDKNEDSWSLYELRNDSSYASELHRASGERNGDLFDVARLDMHADDFGSLCWLPDIELSYSLNCTIFRAEPRYVRELALDFHYKVRDFELKLVDFKRIYALTSSSEESSCVYDLWIFDIQGQLVDGPLRIQGPRCVFTHRLEPRPRITQLSRDKVCVSFAFELSSNYDGSSRRGVKQKQFNVMTECFLHN